MKMIAVVGSGSDSGKTTLVCRILAAVPGLAAVKISPREGECRVEWGPGERGKDTARFAASGAVKVARIVGPRPQVPQLWERLRAGLAGMKGVVVEGAGSVGCRCEKLTIFAASADHLMARPERDEALIAAADLVVIALPTPNHNGPPCKVDLSHLIGTRRCFDLRSASEADYSFRDLVRVIEGFLSGHSVSPER